MSAYEDHFTRYGSSVNYVDDRIYVYCRSSESYETVEDVARAEKDAAAKITEFQKYIDFLQEHRKRLAARYGELCTMNYKTEVKLKRERRDNVHFYLTITRIYDDGTEARQSSKHYAGKERTTAIEEYNAIVKSHPDWIAVKDIEKSKWER